MPLKKIGELTVPSSQECLTQVDNFAEKLIKKTCFDTSDLDDIAIAISEAVNNAILHGNKLDLSKSVNIKLYICNKYLRIAVEDQGGGFNLNRVPDPRQEENLLKASGRGLLIMRHLMDRIRFKSTRTGMQITMEKDCPKG
jgi:serine/threonine-protein kinase RsbW